MICKRGFVFNLLTGILALKAWSQETVRLVEGPDVSEGRVEVYFSGVWGVVCGAGWDAVDAAVLCHSLGYTEVSSFRNNISFKLDNGTLWMTEVQCNGDESSLIHCSHSGWGKNGCAENQAAGVRCLNRARPQFISNSLDSITLEFHVPLMKQVAYTVEIWTNKTKKWLETRCSQSILNDSCVVTNPSKSITVTDLSPGHAYYIRLAFPTRWTSEISQAMETKELGTPVELHFISRSRNSIVLGWSSTNLVLTNYTVEVRCCEEMTWKEAHCMENLIGQDCTISNTTATVIDLKEGKEYFFRVYAVYKNWKSDVSIPSKAMVPTKTEEIEIPQGRIWISPLSPGCATSEIGHTITLFCNAPGISPKVYEWSKGGQLVSNKSVNGVFNLSISSSKDFGLYTCNAISLYGVTTFNISVCSSSSDAVTASTDSFNRTAIAVITACFICFAIFIVVLILLKIARLHRRKKKQALEVNSGREEMAMLHYRQKSFKSANNNEDDGE